MFRDIPLPQGIITQILKVQNHLIYILLQIWDKPSYLHESNEIEYLLLHMNRMHHMQSVFFFIILKSNLSRHITPPLNGLWIKSSKICKKSFSCNINMRRCKPLHLNIESNLSTIALRLG